MQTLTLNCTALIFVVVFGLSTQNGFICVSIILLLLLLFIWLVAIPARHETKTSKPHKHTHTQSHTTTTKILNSFPWFCCKCDDVRTIPHDRTHETIAIDGRSMEEYIGIVEKSHGLNFQSLSWLHSWCDDSSSSVANTQRMERPTKREQAKIRRWDAEQRPSKMFYLFTIWFEQLANFEACLKRRNFAIQIAGNIL